MNGSQRAGRARLPGSLVFLLLVLLLAALGGCALGPSPKPAWEQPPPALKQGPVVAADALTRDRLDNGLAVIVLEDHRLPTVSLALTVPRGAGAVARGRAGLAQLTAEVMNRGAGDRDALALAEAVDALGASLNISAGWDSMSVSVQGLSRDLPTLLSVLGDVALSPRFEAEEVEKARSEQLAGLEAKDDNPAQLVGRQAMEVLYPDHRYGLSVSGSPDTLAPLGPDAVRDLHARFFVPADAILSVSGDIVPADFLAAIRPRFADWGSGGQGQATPSGTPPPPAITPLARKIVIVDKPDLNQTRIIIAQEGIERRDPRRLTASLMNATLGGSGFSSRLMRKLRSEAGLTYGVRSGFSMRSQPGPFSVSTFTRVPETRRAVDMLLAELEAIRAIQPQSDSELAKAKSYLVGQFGLGLETSAAVASGLVNLDVYGLPADSLDTYRARVAAIDVQQTRAVADALLDPGRAAIVLLGPAEALLPQFQDLGPVEIIEP
ncbi:MAG: insulinase family protein [Myxococcota bacterium]|nr:insulinase family protein [Myxococcota bacterium]